MFALKKLALAFALSLFLTLPANAQISTTANSAFIIDTSTGTILLDKDSARRIPTASMSKTMTAYMAFDAIKRGQISLQTKFPVSEKAWRMGGSKMFVELGAEIPVEDLLKGIIVQSGNDATIVLAEGLAGSEERFAAEMTRKAHEIGMKNSNFMNASGWPDPDHYSTARDLTLLSWRMIREFPELYKLFAIREFTWHGITQPNRDPLLGRVEGADGIKTGHTTEAGYGLIGSAVRRGRRVIMVVSGLDSMSARTAESVRLMEWALNAFKTARIFQAGEVLTQVPTNFAIEKSVPLTIDRDVIMTVPVRLTAKDVKASLRLDTPITANLAKGARVGTLTVSIPEMGERQIDVVTAANLTPKGWFARKMENIIHKVGK